MSLAAQIESVQPDVYYKLRSEPYFAPVSIFCLREKRLDVQINNALAGLGAANNTSGTLSSRGTKAGATIEIEMPTLSGAMSNAPGPVSTLEQVFIIKEQPTINLGSNGTGLTAEQIAVNLIQTLQLFFFGEAQNGFYAASDFYRPVDAGPESPFLMIQVKMRATMVLDNLVGTSSPTFSFVNDAGTDTVTLTDAEDGGGSAMYYTIDGLFPGPGNPAATLYTVPFTCPAGTGIRAASYLSGIAGSVVQNFTAT